MAGFVDQTPIVEQVLRKKQELSQASVALPWAAVNATAALAVYYEMCEGPIASSIVLLFRSLVWKSANVALLTRFVYWIEVILFVVLVLNTVVNIYVYVKPSWTRTSIELTPRQRKLLGISDTDISFGTPSVRPQSSSFYLATSKSLNYASFATSSPVSSPLRSWKLSPSLSPQRNTSLPVYSSLSRQDQSVVWSDAIDGDSSKAIRSRKVDASPVVVSGRQSRSTPYFSPGSSPALLDMTDEDSLEKYILAFEKKEHKLEAASESPQTLGASFLNLGSHSLMDYSPMFRKYTYQMANRSSQSATSRSDDDPDSPAHHVEEEVWTKVGITSDTLYCWTKNLRQWLTLTILERLAKEIDAVNDSLRRMGSPDLQIGEVSLSTLRQVSLTKSQFIPTLSILLPYLDATAHQEYLVQRIKELSSGGCMSAFIWNGGGKLKGKPWADHLPTDTAIVMHMFCTYLDARLPPHPNHPDGKTFTNQSFVRTPDKPGIGKDTLCIYQVKVNPPHFKLVIGEEIWELAKGRNNLFHTIILFLYHIKTKENGMLGRINLGLSGVNILWILDSS